MRWLKNNLFKIALISVILIIFLFYLSSYYKKEKNEYISYNDFTRADIVMTLTYNKNFQFYTTRYVQSMNIDKKVSKGDLIYDFAQYKFIPILNYLNSSTENEDLIENFSKFLSFLSDYNFLTIGLRENILVRQSNGKYYTIEEDIYRYYVKMNVIGKEGLNTAYNEYLKNKGYKSVDENFIEKLYRLDVIKKEYSYNELIKEISENYDDFYNRNDDEILKVITLDLKEFNQYLYTYYIYLGEDQGNTTIKLLKEIRTEPIELTFDFKVYDRIYSSIDKHYSHTYILDINDVWEQLEKKGYPKIYS